MGGNEQAKGPGAPNRPERADEPGVDAPLLPSPSRWFSAASDRIAAEQPAARFARISEQRAQMGEELLRRRTPISRKANGAAAGRAKIPESGGAPLAGDARARMERALGADLDGVALHTGAASHAAAQALNARAFTVGRDVHFAAGELAQGTREGDRLLAHELAHAAQAAPGVHRKADGAAGEVSRPDDPHERAADAAADAAVARLHEDGAAPPAPVAPAAAPAGIHRKLHLEEHGQPPSPTWEDFETFKRDQAGQELLARLKPTPDELIVLRQLVDDPHTVHMFTAIELLKSALQPQGREKEKEKEREHEGEKGGSGEKPASSSARELLARICEKYPFFAEALRDSAAPPDVRRWEGGKEDRRHLPQKTALLDAIDATLQGRSTEFALPAFGCVVEPQSFMNPPRAKEGDKEEYKIFRRRLRDQLAALQKQSVWSVESALEKLEALLQSGHVGDDDAARAIAPDHLIVGESHRKQGASMLVGTSLPALKALGYTVLGVELSGAHPADPYNMIAEVEGLDKQAILDRALEQKELIPIAAQCADKGYGGNVPDAEALKHAREMTRFGSLGDVVGEALRLGMRVLCIDYDTTVFLREHRKRTVETDGDVRVPLFDLHAFTVLGTQAAGQKVAMIVGEQHREGMRALTGGAGIGKAV